VTTKKPASHKSTRTRELLAIDGAEVAVNVRLNPRARRMTMRVDPASGEIAVTAPMGTGRTAALAFVKGEMPWLRRQLGLVPPRIVPAPGVTVPFLGMPHRIRASSDKGRAPVWHTADEIFVGGRIEHASRRLIDFFKREAKRNFAVAAHGFAARLGVTASRVTVRDTSSRWGSCSSARSLSFSWRLIFAPDFVREYVVAHEVAHLKEMNHGPRFWALVERLTPHKARARKWLRENGRDLLRYH
jgi:predicted metal-dependent hydrolase